MFYSNFVHQDITVGLYESYVTENQDSKHKSGWIIARRENCHHLLS